VGCICKAKVQKGTQAGEEVMNIQFRNLTKDFGKNRVVNQINLKIEDGEFFFLLGPSGCGKTTSLRMIAGFEHPTAGEIFFRDTNIASLPANKRNIGMVFQNYALWPHMSVFDNVAYGLKVRKIEKVEMEKRVKHALDTVKMGEYIARMPNQLSGGQQQRVALARALVVEPDVLLLDEPLSNLDAKLRLEMREELKHIQASLGVTTVYVTHDQKEALTMGHRLAVMRQGVIEQVGSPREVYNQPNSRFIANFIGETNFIPGRIASISNGRAEISTKCGVIKGVTHGQPFSMDDDVLVAIRPEAIQLEEGDVKANEGDNVVDGEIFDTVYLGESEQLFLRAHGESFKFMKNNPGMHAHSRGENAKIVFPHENAVVLSPN
jgi:spermidine/putrescine ABC transporter ATP-binding subunit